MPLLYDRDEKHDEITIVFKYQALYYVFLLGFILVVFFLPALSAIVFPLFFVGVFIQIAGKWKVNQEVKSAMQGGETVEISGSKFSLKNPLTVKIKK